MACIGAKILGDPQVCARRDRGSSERSSRQRGEGRRRRASLDMTAKKIGLVTGQEDAESSAALRPQKVLSELVCAVLSAGEAGKRRERPGAKRVGRSLITSDRKSYFRRACFTRLVLAGGAAMKKQCSLIGRWKR